MIYYIILLLAFVFVLLLVISDIICRQVLFPTTRSFLETEMIEKNAGNWNNYDVMDKEELNFTLSDGYLIHGTLIWNDRDSKKFIIATHGFRYNRYGSIKYINIFKNKDYNVYIYDLRSHGANEKGLIGMGQHESKDLNQLIQLFRKSQSDDITIALHGESLGAFSSLMVLSYKPIVKFVISDCSYSDTLTELKFQMQNRHTPIFFFWLSSLVAKFKYNQNWAKLDARTVVSNTDVPILFIHGESDKFTPPTMSKELYDCCNSKKELVFFDGAKHAQCENSNPEKYKEVVSSFIDSLD